MFYNGICATNHTRREIFGLLYGRFFLFLLFLQKLKLILEAGAFCVQLSGLGSTQDFLRFETGLEVARLEVQNLRWARARLRMKIRI